MRVIDLIRIAIQRGASPDVISDVSKINEAIQRLSVAAVQRSDKVDAYFQRGASKTLTGELSVTAGASLATLDTSIPNRSYVGYGFFIDGVFYRIENYYTSGGTQYVEFDKEFLSTATYDDKSVVKLSFIPKLYTGEPVYRHRGGLSLATDDRVFATRRSYNSNVYAINSAPELPVPPAPTAVVGAGAASTSVAGVYGFRAAYVFGDRISKLSDKTSATIVNTNDVVTLSLPFAHYPGYDVVYTAEGKIGSLDFNALTGSTVGPRRFVSGSNVSEALIGVAKQHFDTDDALEVEFGYDPGARANHSIVGYKRPRRVYDFNEQINVIPAVADAFVAMMMYYSTNDVQYLNVARYAVETARSNRVAL